MENKNDKTGRKAPVLSVKDMALTALFSALMAVCAWITIPVPDIPFTLQLFAIFAAMFILGGKRAFISVIIYVLIGAVGVPVFSGFKGGLSSLLGPTGGYIIGFIFSVAVYWLITARLPKKTAVQIISAVISLLVCYAFGTLWFVIVYSKYAGPVGFGAALLMCVVPYIIPDLCKIALAFAVSKLIKKAIGSAV